MMERGLVAYWNGDLVDIYIYIYIYNMGNVQLRFFLWFNLGIQILKLDRC